MCQRELPLLVVVEGENDICFLKGMSRMLHRADPELPDLSQLANDRRITFLPTGGSNLSEWVSRLTCLHKREFYLFDREQEPETSARRQVIEFINTRPGCFATLTTKRTVENYLHPLAIREACGIDLVFDDDTDVAGLLALKLMARKWRDFVASAAVQATEAIARAGQEDPEHERGPANDAGSAGPARSPWRSGRLAAHDPSDGRGKAPSIRFIESNSGGVDHVRVFHRS